MKVAAFNLLDRCFPSALRYTDPSAFHKSAVRESSFAALLEPPSERHLQSLWFDPRWRPAQLTTARNEPVTVEHPGRWNLEAGPDFISATLLIGTERRRVEGDIEIHVRPSDWQQHGHTNDPRYRRVIAHITWASGLLPEGALPTGAVQISLRKAVQSNPLFSFDLLDLTAYPYAVHAQPTPCLAAFRNWTANQRATFLEAAGQERLRRKAERLLLSFQDRGEDQTIYEEVLLALGYKHNKQPFLQLARTLPLTALREAADNNPETAYALLLGVAGLLPADLPAAASTTAHTFVRRLWNIWWKQREAWDAVLLPANLWQRAGMRPANHPARRLWAAAMLFTTPQTPSATWRALAAAPEGTVVKSFLDYLQNIPGDFWPHHLSWTGPEQTAASAILGPDRARALLINLWIPYLAAIGKTDLFAERRFLASLPAEDSNAVIRQMAHTLLGPDYPPALLRPTLHRQGLIQIFHDHCLPDRSQCQHCGLPGLLDNFIPADITG